MTLTEAYGLMKTGTTESVVPGIVLMPELGLDADEVEESVDMALDQKIGAEGEAAARPGGSAAREAARHGAAQPGRAARPGGAVDVRAEWRRMGIRAAEGLGARKLGPGLVIPCREVEIEKTPHILSGG